MKSEKAVAETTAQIRNDNGLTMNNLPNFQFKSNADGDRSRRELLEQTKLSRLPEQQRRPFPQKAAAGCVSCGVRLDLFDPVQIAFGGCRKCIGIYGRLDAAFDEKAKCDRRELLERFTEGAK